MKIIIYLFVLLLIGFMSSGCATKLTEQGRMIRQIQPDWSTSCKFLGVIDASEIDGWDIADNRRGALNSIRNQVAEMGGNAFVVSQTTTSELRTLIQADAYKCPE